MGASTDRRQKWWWWLDQADAWMQSFEDRKRAALTPVDRTGDPDDALTSAQAAQVLGCRSADSLQPAFLKLADEIEELPSGRKRRRWRRATVWAYADNRTGKGGKGAPRGNANPRPRPPADRPHRRPRRTRQPHRSHEPSTTPARRASPAAFVITPTR